MPERGHPANLQPGRIARLTRRLLLPGLALAALAAALRLALGPGVLGYDAAYALVWGEELLAPDYGARLAPTPHPLANVAGGIAALFGDAAEDLLVALSFAAFAGVGVAAFAVGRRTFGTVAGVAFAAILLSRPRLVEQALQASVDIPFLALVLAALAVALPPREGPLVALTLLGVAGLLRPEAWPLAVLYGVLAAREDPSARTRIAALAVAGPALWLLYDLLATGDPLFSLTSTQELAGTLERERGLAAALDFLPPSLSELLRPGVVWAGVAVGAVAVVVAQERAAFPLAILALGLGGFLALGLLDLPLLVRYLVVPGAMLALLCAAGVGAFAWLPSRAAGAVAGVAVAAVVLGGAPAVVDAIGARQDRIAGTRDAERSLARLAALVPAGCRPVQVSTDRAVPVLAHLLGVRPSEIVVAPATSDRGVAFTARAAIAGADIDPDPSVPATDARAPAGFRRLGGDGPWTLAARC